MGEDAKSVELDTATAATRASVLYSAFGDYDVCSRLDTRRLDDPDATIAAYTNPGVPDVVQTVGGFIADFPARERATAVALAHDILCAVKDAEDE